MAVSPVMTHSAATTKSSSSTTATNATSGNVGTGSSANELLDSFMTLLVAQMQNQDPTDPMDNNQLTAQLAQFNTAAGVEQLNTTMNSMGTLVASMQQMNSADWVGRDIMIAGDPKVSTAEDGNQKVGLSLDSDADEVTVTLTDAAGNAYNAKLKNVEAGVHEYTLDDFDDFQPSDPRSQPDTHFTVSFTATNADGSAPSVTALKPAKVQSVSFTSSGAVLQLGVDGTASLSEVYLIE
ncbi:flagellar hook capping FlgD N-terminal domain-containing protein [Kosakonia cowanii]|uniref:flagellar hook assembly protein FlgD n=1 Tax=Kosakonia cowanii TaxID=208223 RepID=UPI0023F7B67C|nr:flagellar hook capping FlgD N-terminal domain-containing protein [Kosakonia cowanii]MDF7759584.1 flagellar hook capping FlgD N-terminal domain-containing protein [Kosakonia cowanii]